MLFRRLNWNIVGWFRIVSAISYIIIGLGLASMIYHGFQGGQGFQAKNMLKLGLSFTGGTDITVQYTQPTTVGAVTAALSGLGLTDESITTAGTDGKGFVIQTQSSFANDSTPDVESARHRRSGRSCEVADLRGRSVARARIPHQRAAGAGDRARHPVRLHRVPLRLELHLRPRHRHRAGSRRADDDRHLRARRPPCRRRVPGCRADGHRLLRHGYDRHSRSNSRKHQGHGRPSRTT